MKFDIGKITVASLFCLSVYVFGQEITLDKIYSGRYQVRGIQGISSMNDGEHYSVLEKNGIVKYSYKTGEKVATILEAKVEDYVFSPDERKVLVLNEQIPIYRHSFLGKYQIVDLDKGGRSLALNNGKWVQEPKFSPNGKMVAFISENNLFYQDLETGKIIQITYDGAKNKIINGLADWVYEEEFGHADMYQWTGNSEALVFVKFDESEVKEMNMQIFDKNLYPQDFRFKYPKAGEENSKVSAWIYKLKENKQTPINLDKYEKYYISQVFTTKNQNEIAIATANRHQNKVNIIKVNIKTHTTQSILVENSNAWIDIDHLTLEFLEDDSFLWISERDGYPHIYWYNANGKLKKQITKGKWEVTNYYGFNPKTDDIFVQTTQKGSINRVITKINIKTGKQHFLSEEDGQNNANFSKSFQYFINTHSSAKQAYTYTLKDINGKTIRELRNNNEVLQKLQADNFVSREFFSIPNEVGDQMNAYIIKPKNFNSKKKYPVLMFQYSGPGSQQVSNVWDSGNVLWFNHLVQNGYLVVAVDGRGTGYRGTQYKKVTYKNLGKYEIEDQIAAAKWLGKQTFVDKDRIGIFGWSFGGYMATLAMTKGADIFKVGIAVAPVTTWRYYDTVYTERFLQTPQENPKGYDENSPINFAHLLKGKYLLIHGTADDNVHYQNAVEMAEALIQNGKDFEFMTYPDKNHSIRGGKARQHLYQKMTDFILNNL